MGKRHHRARSNHNSEQHNSVDELRIGDVSRTAEQRGIIPAPSGDWEFRDADAPGGSAENFDSSKRDDLSQRECDVRHIDAERLRVLGSEAPEVRRSFNPADLNPLINGPVALKGIEHIDASPLLADDRNVLLTCEGGAILFCWNSPATYEISEFWHPGIANSPHAQQAVMLALCWMFSNTDCQTIFAKVPYISKVSNSPLLIRAPNNIIQILNDRLFKVIK